MSAYLSFSIHAPPWIQTINGNGFFVLGEDKYRANAFVNCHLHMVCFDKTPYLPEKAFAPVRFVQKMLQQ
jgi:hypothetical protein